MGVLISSANFTGKWAIPNQSFGVLDQWINDREEDYLNGLLGAAMYADFKSTLTGSPQAPPPTSVGYYAVYNPFAVDYGSKIYKSKGLVKMLMGFIFFDYMKELRFKNTQNGQEVAKLDTGNTVQVGNLYSYLNEATNTYQAIQAYIQNIHPEQFSTTIEFNGQYKSVGISIFG